MAANRDRERNESILARFMCRSFPGFFGSLDCMKLKWNNHPIKLGENCKKRERKLTIVLGTYCNDLISSMNGFLGVPAANNDLNILSAPPINRQVLKASWPHVSRLVATR